MMGKVRFRKALAVVAIMTVAASMAAPAALAKSDKSKSDKNKGKSEQGKSHGGKKAVGEITSYDAATGAIQITLTDGTVFSGTAGEDTQVKVEHRGNHSKGKGHGNPSNGDQSDLVAGAQVLRYKTAEDGVTVEKIRIRPVPAAEEETPAEEEVPAEGDAPVEEGPIEEAPVEEVDPCLADPAACTP